MTFFVVVGCGTAVSFSAIPSANSEFTSGIADVDDNTVIVNQLRADLKINSSFGVNTALAFGIGIMVLVYTSKCL